MKIIKLNNHYVKRGSTLNLRNQPTVRRCGSNLWINAAARDVLNDPDYVSIDYCEKTGTVTISPSNDPNDFKITKTNSGRSFSCVRIFEILGIQTNELRTMEKKVDHLVLNVPEKERV